MAYIYSLCQQRDTAGIVDVYDKIERRLVNPKQLRPARTCLQALSRFLHDEKAGITERAMIVRLRAHCKRAVLDTFAALSDMITGEFNGTGCIRASEPPRERPNGSLDVVIHQCKRDNVQCTVHTFFEEHSTVFEQIAAFVDTNPGCSRELQRMRDHIRLAQKDPFHLCDRKFCSKLADALIAVDGRDMDEFAANNPGEWVPIAQIMKKRLLNPVKQGQDK